MFEKCFDIDTFDEPVCERWKLWTVLYNLSIEFHKFDIDTVMTQNLEMILLNIEVVSASQWSLLLTTVSIYGNLFKFKCVKIRLYHFLKFKSKALVVECYKEKALL